MSSAAICEELSDILDKGFNESREQEALKLLDQASQAELESFRSEYRDTLLNQAVKGGFLQVTMRLAKKAPALIRVKGRFGFLPVHNAADCDALEATQFLAAIDPSTLEVQCDDGERVALHFACRYGSEAVTKLLVFLAPQTLQAKNSYEETPLRVSINGRKFLEEYTSNSDKFACEAAAVRSRCEQIRANFQGGSSQAEQKLLAEQKAGLLAENIYELLRAGFSADRELEAERLLQRASARGITNFRTHQSESLLSLAVAEGFLRLAKQIAAKAPALIRARDQNGFTALHVASRVDALEAAKFLAAIEPKLLEDKDTEKRLPLHWACRQASLPLVQWILFLAPHTLHARDDWGFTVLSWTHSADAYPFLLDFGIRPQQFAAEVEAVKKEADTIKQQFLQLQQQLQQQEQEQEEEEEEEEEDSSSGEQAARAAALFAALDQLVQAGFCKQTADTATATTEINAVITKLFELQQQTATGFESAVVVDLTTLYQQLCCPAAAAFVTATDRRKELVADFQRGREANWRSRIVAQRNAIASLLTAVEELSLNEKDAAVVNKKQQQMSVEEAQQILEAEIKDSREELRSRAVAAWNRFIDSIKDLPIQNESAVKASLAAARAEVLPLVQQVNDAFSTRKSVAAAFAVLKNRLVAQLNKQKQVAHQMETRLRALSATAAKISSAAKRLPQLLEQLPAFQDAYIDACIDYSSAETKFQHKRISQEALDAAKAKKSQAYAAFQPHYKELYSFVSVLPELAQHTIIQQEQQRIMDKISGVLDAVGGANVLEKLANVSFVDEYYEESRQQMVRSNFPICKIKRRDNNEWVVVKEFPISKTDHEGLRSFVSSISVMSRLEHPHLLAMNRAFHDADYNPSCWYLEMPCLHQNLQEYLEKKAVEALPGQEAAEFAAPSLHLIKMLFLQTCKGVYFLHCNNVIHADLKPANVLLRLGDDKKTPVAVVADFERSIDEVARRALLTSSISVGSSAIGTLGYIAPELLESKEPSPSKESDVFSLGKILEWMLEAVADNSDAAEIGSLKRLAAAMTSTVPVERPSLEQVILGGALSNKDEVAKPDCCVCLVEAADHILIPCGHVCVCKDCIGALRSSAAKCPLCRVHIRSSAKVFY